jgi:threonine/homoserine/homoserine lactone efflux protein
MAPVRSNSRSRRWHGERLIRTRAASSVTVSRPSRWSSATIFRAISAVLVLVPGADLAYVMAAGLRDRTVWPAVSGLRLGYLGLTAVVATGVATVVAGVPAVLTALTAVGAAYLVWLGISILWHPPAGVEAVDRESFAPARALARGLGVSGLNPKGLLLFLALLPQFTDPGGAWPPAAQIALLGVLHTANCGVGYLGVGVLTRAVLRARPAAARRTSRLSGIAMIVFGAALLAEHWL